MGMSSLIFRQQSRAEADARRWIGKGQTLAFSHDNQPGELSIRLSENAATDAQWQRFSCAAGSLAFSDFAPLFSLLSECPAMSGDSDDDGEWYWGLFNQSLFSEVASLFGSLRPQDPAASGPDALCLQIQVTFAGQQARSLLRLSADTLNRLATTPGWQAQGAALIAALPLNLPLVVATFSLPLEEITLLQAGDVLRAPSSHFGVEGDGVINIGQWALHGALQPSPDSPHSAYFSLYDIKELTMSYPNDPLLPEDEDNPYPHVDETESGYYASSDLHDIGGESQLNAALNALPLELSIRCGQLKLTLGELQQLDVGSTLVVDNVTPGAAMLCHGSFPIAKGELVNVDGRLGLQLTSIINNQPVGAEKGV
jgi:type III secretion protein Q